MLSSRSGVPISTSVRMISRRVAPARRRGALSSALKAATAVMGGILARAGAGDQRAVVAAVVEALAGARSWANRCGRDAWFHGQVDTKAKIGYYSVYGSQ